MNFLSVPPETAFLKKDQRFEVFGEYARYQPDHSLSGTDTYVIRVGDGTLFASDTLELYLKFDEWALAQRRLERVKVARPWRVCDALSGRPLRMYFSSRKSAAQRAGSLNGSYVVKKEER